MLGSRTLITFATSLETLIPTNMDPFKPKTLIRCRAVLLLLATTLLPAYGIGQIATYDFAGNGNATDPFVGVANVANLTAGDMTRIGVTAGSSTGNFRASNWPTGATNGSNAFSGSIDPGKYIQFSLTPGVGYTMDVIGLTFGIGRSATGPRQFSVRTSADAFATDLTGGTAGTGATFATGQFTITADASTNISGNSIALSGPSFTGLSSTLTVRVYGLNAEASGGTGGLAGSMVVSGSVNAAGGCGISLGTVEATCNAITPGVDTYDLSIAYIGSDGGTTVVNNGASGTISGDDPAAVPNGTIVISGITEGEGYDVSFTSPCDALSVTGSSPMCEPPSCGITLGAVDAICNSITAGPGDTYNVSIVYSGSQGGVTVINNGASGTIGGDDPAVISDGTIVISGIAETDGYDVTLSAPCDVLTVSGAAPDCEPAPTTTIVINEVDSDTPGSDVLEFVELFGPANESLDGMVLVLYNGSNDLSYAAFDLDTYSLDANGFFVIGNAAVANVDLVIPANTLQNGQDAVALYFGNGADFPNNTPVTTSNIIDAVVYDTNDADDAGLLVLVNVGQPQVNESANGTSDVESISRVPDGGTQLNTDSYVTQAPTPGTSNAVICELTLGTITAVCETITIGAGDTYSVSIPYIGLQAGVTVVNNSGSGTVGGDDPAIVLDGTIVVTGIDEAIGYSVTFSAPCGTLVASGNAPICEPEPTPPLLVINEVDYDQPSTDTEEFVEIKNVGVDPADLTGLMLILWNGSNNLPYDTVFLDPVVLAAGDYYVIGRATVSNVDQIAFATTNIQNGPDGLRLATAFGTVIDQMSYGNATIATTEGSSSTTDLSLLGISLSRVPDGVDTDDNGFDFLRACASPGLDNTQSDADNDGTFDCLDQCPGGPEPGTACDDNDATTADDVIQGDCTCAGTPVDCEGVPDGPAVPGTPCIDGDPFTINDVYQADCSCLGVEPDCLGIPGGPNVPGAPCNDFIASTNDETYDQFCQCVGTPCSQNVTLELRSDNNSSQMGWEIVYQNDNTVVCSGGTLGTPYIDGITSPITEPCCLPIGCFRLRVYDSGGDGFASGDIIGGYQLRESGANGRRIIDNLGNFANGTSSAISNTYENGAFCVPIGDDRTIFSSCDKLDWVTNKFIVASENAAVSAQYGVSNANSGYVFWFYDPNGTFSYRRFRSHATSDGYGTGATRACHFRVNGWVDSPSTPHLPADVLLNVRIKGRVAGSNLPFGPACLFKIDAARAACPLVKLQDNPLSNDFSCGVNKVFGGSNSGANRITANPPQPIPVVSSANVRYQFRFRNGEYPNPAGCIVRPPQTSATMYLNWSAASGTQLQCNTQYLVDVRVSLDGGATWCVGDASSSPATNCADPGDESTAWGKLCNVNITTSTNCNGLQGGSSSLAAQQNGTLVLYPNPNQGDQLRISLSEVSNEVNTVTVDIYDLTGKRVIARTIAVQDGYVNTTMDLGGSLSSGLYMVNITAGDKNYTERLVVQP